MNWLLNNIKLSLFASYMKYVLFIGTILLLDTLKCRFGCHSPNHFLPLRISEKLSKKRFVCQCPPFCQFEFVLMAQKGSMMHLQQPSTIWKPHVVTTGRLFLWLAWLCLFLSCYLFANDPEMTPTFIEDKHEFNLQHISLLVIIDVSRQATFYSDFML